MKICATSDLHGHLPSIPKCDLFLIAGDLCPGFDHNLYFQELWLKSNFIDWLKEIPAKHIIFIAGNHDFYFEAVNKANYPRIHRVFNTYSYLHPMTRSKWYYLEDDLIEIDGLKIYGSPWQLEFYNWAFNLNEMELSQRFENIPKCDILLTHSPAFGCGDRVSPSKDYPRKNSGCEMINQKCLEHNIKLHFSGHIHQGYSSSPYMIGKTRSYNVSLCNERCNPINEPIMVEL